MMRLRRQENRMVGIPSVYMIVVGILQVIA